MVARALVPALPSSLSAQPRRATAALPSNLAGRLATTPALPAEPAASGQGRGMSGFNDGQNFRDRLSAYLRRQHPTKTEYGVSADTGLPADSVRKWLAGHAAPGFTSTIRLIDVYGPELLCAIHGADMPGWLDDNARAQKRAALRALRDELQARLDGI